MRRCYFFVNIIVCVIIFYFQLCKSSAKHQRHPTLQERSIKTTTESTSTVLKIPNKHHRRSIFLKRLLCSEGSSSTSSLLESTTSKKEISISSMVEKNTTTSQSTDILSTSKKGKKSTKLKKNRVSSTLSKESFTSSIELPVTNSRESTTSSKSKKKKKLTLLPPKMKVTEMKNRLKRTTPKKSAAKTNKKLEYQENYFCDSGITEYEIINNEELTTYPHALGPILDKEEIKKIRNQPDLAMAYGTNCVTTTKNNDTTMNYSTTNNKDTLCVSDLMIEEDTTENNKQNLTIKQNITEDITENSSLQTTIESGLQNKKIQCNHLHTISISNTNCENSTQISALQNLIINNTTLLLSNETTALLLSNTSASVPNDINQYLLNEITVLVPNITSQYTNFLTMNSIFNTSNINNTNSSHNDSKNNSLSLTNSTKANKYDINDLSSKKRINKNFTQSYMNELRQNTTVKYVDVLNTSNRNHTNNTTNGISLPTQSNIHKVFNKYNLSTTNNRNDTSKYILLTTKSSIYNITAASYHQILYNTNNIDHELITSETKQIAINNTNSNTSNMTQYKSSTPLSMLDVLKLYGKEINNSELLLNVLNLQLDKLPIPFIENPKTNLSLPNFEESYNVIVASKSDVTKQTSNNRDIELKFFNIALKNITIPFLTVPTKSPVIKITQTSKDNQDVETNEIKLLNNSELFKNFQQHEWHNLIKCIDTSIMHPSFNNNLQFNINNMKSYSERNPLNQPKFLMMPSMYPFIRIVPIPIKNPEVERNKIKLLNNPELFKNLQHYEVQNLKTTCFDETMMHSSLSNYLQLNNNNSLKSNEGERRLNQSKIILQNQNLGLYNEKLPIFCLYPINSLVARNPFIAISTTEKPEVEITTSFQDILIWTTRQEYLNLDPEKLFNSLFTRQLNIYKKKMWLQRNNAENSKWLNTSSFKQHSLMNKRDGRAFKNTFNQKELVNLMKSIYNKFLQTMNSKQSNTFGYTNYVLPYTGNTFTMPYELPMQTKKNIHIIKKRTYKRLNNNIISNLHSKSNRQQFIVSKREHKQNILNKFLPDRLFHNNKINSSNNSNNNNKAEQYLPIYLNITKLKAQVPYIVNVQINITEMPFNKFKNDSESNFTIMNKQFNEKTNSSILLLKSKERAQTSIKTSKPTDKTSKSILVATNRSSFSTITEVFTNSNSLSVSTANDINNPVAIENQQLGLNSYYNKNSSIKNNDYDEIMNKNLTDILSNDIVFTEKELHAYGMFEEEYRETHKSRNLNETTLKTGTLALNEISYKTKIQPENMKLINFITPGIIHPIKLSGISSITDTLLTTKRCDTSKYTLKEFTKFGKESQTMKMQHQSTMNNVENKTPNTVTEIIATESSVTDAKLLSLGNTIVSSTEIINNGSSTTIMNNSKEQTADLKINTSCGSKITLPECQIIVTPQSETTGYLTMVPPISENIGYSVNQTIVAPVSETTSCSVIQTAVTSVSETTASIADYSVTTTPESKDKLPFINNTTLLLPSVNNEITSTAMYLSNLVSTTAPHCIKNENNPVIPDALINNISSILFRLHNEISNINKTVNSCINQTAISLRTENTNYNIDTSPVITKTILPTTNHFDVSLTMGVDNSTSNKDTTINDTPLCTTNNYNIAENSTISTEQQTTLLPSNKNENTEFNTDVSLLTTNTNITSESRTTEIITENSAISTKIPTEISINKTELPTLSSKINFPVECCPLVSNLTIHNITNILLIGSDYEKINIKVCSTKLDQTVKHTVDPIFRKHEIIKPKFRRKINKKISLYNRYFDYGDEDDAIKMIKNKINFRKLNSTFQEKAHFLKEGNPLEYKCNFSHHKLIQNIATSNYLNNNCTCNSTSEQVAKKIYKIPFDEVILEHKKHLQQGKISHITNLFTSEENEHNKLQIVLTNTPSIDESNTKKTKNNDKILTDNRSDKNSIRKYVVEDKTYFIPYIYIDINKSDDIELFKALLKEKQRLLNIRNHTNGDPELLGNKKLIFEKNIVSYISGLKITPTENITYAPTHEKVTAVNLQDFNDNYSRILKFTQPLSIFSILSSQKMLKRNLTLLRDILLSQTTQSPSFLITESKLFQGEGQHTTKLIKQIFQHPLSFIKLGPSENEKYQKNVRHNLKLTTYQKLLSYILPNQRVGEDIQTSIKQRRSRLPSHEKIIFDSVLTKQKNIFELKNKLKSKLLVQKTAKILHRPKAGEKLNNHDQQVSREKTELFQIQQTISPLALQKILNSSSIYRKREKFWRVKPQIQELRKTPTKNVESLLMKISESNTSRAL